jgi:hypothetical protein
LEKLLNNYAANIKGTDQYWGSVLRKWQATSLFLSYVHDLEPTVFWTGSIAEYHDPFLRRLLSKYVGLVECYEEGVQMLSDDEKFRRAVSRYKQVVTHYFACKTETWFSSFLSEVVGLQHANWRYEFAKSRGAIHVHSILTTKSIIDNKLSAAIASAGTKVRIAVEKLNEDLQQFPPTTLHLHFQGCFSL